MRYEEYVESFNALKASRQAVVLVTEADKN